MYYLTVAENTILHTSIFKCVDLRLQAVVWFKLLFLGNNSSSISSGCICYIWWNIFYILVINSSIIINNLLSFTNYSKLRFKITHYGSTFESLSTFYLATILSKVCFRPHFLPHSSSRKVVILILLDNCCIE